MKNIEIGNVNISVYYDERKVKRNGCYPVKYRVTYLQKSKYYPCMDLTQEEWRLITNKRGKKPDAIVRYKKQIETGMKQLREAIEKLNERDGFSFVGLDRVLSRGTLDSVLSAFDNRIASLRSDGKISTAVWYECARNSIENYAKRDLKFSEVTVEWLKGYEKYLDKDEERKFTTISMYQRALRAIINLGLRDNIITHAQYPYVVKKNGKYQIPTETGRKIALSEDQVMKLLDIELSTKDEQWRDLWFFSFQCNGANFADILRFTKKNIVGGYIEWNREKTLSTDPDKTKIRAKITEDMAEIIRKWSKPEGEYLFPFLRSGMSAEQQYKTIKNVIRLTNKKMKKIGEEMGLNFPLSTYAARHSFSNIAQRNKISVYQISKSLGHRSLKTTSVYLESLADGEVDAISNVLPSKKKRNE
jgi:integrase